MGYEQFCMFGSLDELLFELTNCSYTQQV